MAKKEMKQKRNKEQLQTYSLVSGICLLLYFASFGGMMMPMIFFPGTILTWLVGLVTGILAWQKDEKYGKTLTITWIVLTILGIFFFLFMFFMMVGLFGVGMASLLSALR